MLHEAMAYREALLLLCDLIRWSFITLGSFNVSKQRNIQMTSVKSIYLVSYDLNADTGNYVAVHDAINSLGVVNRCLESSWLVSSSMTEEQVFNVINQVLGSGDRCFICKLDMPHYWGVTSKEYSVWTWLKQQCGCKDENK